MSQIEYLRRIKKLIDNPDPEALVKSLRDVHVKGLFSLVIDGTDNGKLTRVFIAKNKVSPMDIQLHSHRYGIRLTPLKGVVTEYVFTENKDVGNSCQKTIKTSLFEYKSPLNGGNGLKYVDSVYGTVESQIIPIGSSTFMQGDDIHTISCSKGSIWIVEEKGFSTERSLVLGTPFKTEELYNEPKQYEVNDNHQFVREALNEIINDFNSLN